MNFVALDFETATPQRDSPCEIGITVVREREIVETRSWLIKPLYYPHFSSFNIAVHGIRPADVKDQPDFAELWPELKPYLEGQLLIAHNASFDMSVLRKTLATYGIPLPEARYTCSLKFSKNIWKGMHKYDLKTLCNMHRIDFLHHRAASDADACARLSLKALALTGTSSEEEFDVRMGCKIARV
ncbi:MULTISPECIES: 3'-5' exonuclease [Pontibacter]|uniref:DNA polymerase-3 subunit epsilon n=1 Tax=Pontibacter lucknowensis TaxID=1077936 RepID=A0A1N6WJ76_9BACT|nr:MULTISPECIES: 3'-5' exonuclease [Pontibacter]EJF08997.1 exonuclease rnase t and DNA polymerase iii [Pontibacter sp. BAB1700]SIQ90197.1 DNA polymerase-3 subunit epsilon [Pontibacter lucknowensis]